MIFLRLTDSTNIKGMNDINNNDKDIIFTECCRKNNIAKHFEYKEGNFIYKNDMLITKLIPSKEKEIFAKHPFYLLETEHSSILFQDINEDAIFYILNSEDEIVPTKFIDLTEDDTIIMYEEITEDYFYSDVIGIQIIEWSEEIDQTLSNYLIHANDGLIINNFLIS